MRAMIVQATDDDPRYSSLGELPDNLARWVRRTALRTGVSTADVIAGCIAHCADGNHFLGDKANGERLT